MNKKYLVLVISTLVVAFGVLLLTVVKPRQKYVEPNPKDIEIETSKSSTAKLEIFTPTVTISWPDSNEEKEGKDGDEIPVGTKLKTNDQGRVQIVYSNGSVTRLDHNTEIILSQLNEIPFQVSVNLVSSRVWSRIVKLLGGEFYQTETTTLIASIRGTSYNHGILPDGRNRGIVTNGKVSMQCIGGNSPIVVEKGNLAITDCKKETELRKISPKEFEDEWIDFNLKEDEKQLP